MVSIVAGRVRSGGDDSQPNTIITFADFDGNNVDKLRFAVDRYSVAWKGSRADVACDAKASTGSDALDPISLLLSVLNLVASIICQGINAPYSQFEKGEWTTADALECAGWGISFLPLIVNVV
jgi:hypothetical protein